MTFAMTPSHGWLMVWLMAFGLPPYTSVFGLKFPELFGRLSDISGADVPNYPMISMFFLAGYSFWGSPKILDLNIQCFRNLIFPNN